jgi:Amt family ammonium transporter
MWVREGLAIQRGFQLKGTFDMWRKWALASLLGMMVLGSMTVNPVFAQDKVEAVETPTAAAPEKKPEEKKPEEATAMDKGTEAPSAPTATGPSNADLKIAMDTLWVLVTAMLVFFMNLGFAAVESGMCRAKNCVNILSKNFIVFAVSSIAFWIVGWGIMFGDGTPYFGNTGLWFVSGADNSPATGADYKGVYSAINWTGVPLSAKFFFQLVFTGTAATIVSGAVAERIKYHTFIVFSFIMGTLIYPVVGHWIWGGGWLAAKGFFDFAGSTQVHSIGGWAALTGVLVLGPRIGKYNAEGKVQAIPGHNMSLATIGCFVLWFGWFGFNPGSTMAVDPGLISHVAVTTNTAAAFATITATITAWLILGKPDLGMTLNGCLAGLVAITAPCAFVSVLSSVIIGSIAGVVVVLAVMAFDRIKVDDPVGATSVHLVNGVFGTICIGLFADASLCPKGPDGVALLKTGLFTGGNADQLMIQLTGVVATAAYVLPVSFIVWIILKYTMGLRVSREEEIEGLDHHEHGNEAYPGFVMQAPGH